MEICWKHPRNVSRIRRRVDDEGKVKFAGWLLFTNMVLHVALNPCGKLLSPPVWWPSFSLYDIPRLNCVSPFIPCVFLWRAWSFLLPSCWFSSPPKENHVALRSNFSCLPSVSSSLCFDQIDQRRRQAGPARRQFTLGGILPHHGGRCQPSRRIPRHAQTRAGEETAQQLWRWQFRSRRTRRARRLRPAGRRRSGQLIHAIGAHGRPPERVE